MVQQKSKSTRVGLSVTVVVATVAATFLYVKDKGYRSAQTPSTYDGANAKESIIGKVGTSQQSSKLSPRPMEVLPQKSLEDKRLAYLREDKPLEGEERAEFLKEVSHVFGELVPESVDAKMVMPHIIAINERYRRGLRTLLDVIAIPPKSNEEIRPRITYIDYIAYRMRWDVRSRSDIADLLTNTVPAGVSLEFQAAFVGDKVELMNALSKHDWPLAISCLSKIKDPWLARKLAGAALDGRKDDPDYNMVEDKSAILNVVPSFGS